MHAYITGGPHARMHTLLRSSARACVHYWGPACTHAHVAEEQRACMRTLLGARMHACTHC